MTRPTNISPNIFGVTFEKEGSVFYAAPSDAVEHVLLGLLCHEGEAQGSTVKCQLLTRPVARLLECYRPARIIAATAEHDSILTLRRAGVHVEAGKILSPGAPLRAKDRLLSDLSGTAESSESFRDELRMRLLSALQKQQSLVPDWMSITPETCLGGGGGGT